MIIRGTASATRIARLVAWSACCAALLFGSSSIAAASPSWLITDLHTHTYLSDGSFSQSMVAHQSFEHFGVGFLANTDHGGETWKTADGSALSSPMWRWKSIEEQSWPTISRLRLRYPSRMPMQGFEWHVPGAEHASVGIVSDEPTAVAQFEYRFDAADKDTSQSAWTKQNADLTDAIAGVSWLESTYPGRSWVVFNHPSRKLRTDTYKIRALHDAAPNTVLGLEGIPGRQKKDARGGYNVIHDSRVPLARTYGGADYMVAKVGGAWDSLLGEGRHLWMFGDADFHSTTGDFWPGEYTRTYTRVPTRDSAGVIAGMQAGDSYTVTGRLVRDFQVTLSTDETSATLGQTLAVRPGQDVRVSVRFRVPRTSLAGRHPSLHHLDLISGETTAPAAPGSPGYYATTNPTTRVIKRFERPGNAWRGLSPSGTWYQVSYTMRNVRSDRYVRFRGTNLPPGTKGETDRAGNPMRDAEGANNAAVAMRDTWLYSNPVFIDVQSFAP